MIFMILNDFWIILLIKGRFSFNVFDGSKTKVEVLRGFWGI
jgi:hypothetical protein